MSIRLPLAARIASLALLLALAALEAQAQRVVPSIRAPLPDEPLACQPGIPAPGCPARFLPAPVTTAVFGGADAVDALAGHVVLPPNLLPVVPLADTSAYLLSDGRVGAPLTIEQEGLVGCGPFWGFSCDRFGIDPFNAEASVLTQSWVGFGNAPGLVAPPAFTVQPGTGAVLIQPGIFASELAVLSYNLQMLLVVLSSSGNPSARDQLDPAHPYAVYDPRDPGTGPFQGRCSFLQPQFCASVQAYFDALHPRRDVRAGGNGRFGRRDFFWPGELPPPGCLPPRRGLSRLSGPPAPRSPGEPFVKRRERCPRR